MFASAGIDNMELRLAVTGEEARALERACHLQTKDGKWFVLLGSATNPLILVRFQPGRILADLNVPKIVFGHNVHLAGPGDVEGAVRVLSMKTERFAPRLDWQRAEVTRLHVAFSKEVANFEAYAKLTKAPRGYWQYSQFVTPNGYINAKGKNQPVNYYDKAQHFKKEMKDLPKEVRLKMECEDNYLYRFEARINQSPRMELKKHGGWNGSSLLAEDLYGAGFISAMRYLEWKFARHVPIPVIRTPTLPSNPTAKAYAAHNLRETAFENPERMRERAREDHKRGAINSTVLDSELARADLFEQRARALELRESVATECRKFNAEILGSLETMEMGLMLHANTDTLTQFRETLSERDRTRLDTALTELAKKRVREELLEGSDERLRSLLAQGEIPPVLFQWALAVRDSERPKEPAY